MSGLETDRTIASVVANAERRLADRERAVAQLSAVTSPDYAGRMLMQTGDTRLLDLLARLHAAHGFDDETRQMAHDALNGTPTLLDVAVARAFDVPVRTIDGKLAWPRPKLRLQLINALGLMPVLTRLVTWLAAALQRIQPVLDRVDPRKAARQRRRNARRPGRTITVTLTVDTTAFNNAMRRVGSSAAEAGAALRQTLDRYDVRMLAAEQRREALAWLDLHVAGVYTDLGLERTPEAPTTKESL